MGWQSAVTVQLQAGNTIINPNGTFVYSSAPALGNLIASVAPAAGTDPFGNSYVEGIAAYGHFGGDLVSLQLGTGNFGGTPTPAFFTHDNDSPAFSDPMFGGTGTGGGTDAILWSGAATAGSTGSGIEAQDSTGSGVPNGQVSIIGGLCVVQGALQVDGSLTVGGSSNTGEGASDASILTTSGNFNGGTLTSHNHSIGHTHPF